MSVLEEEKEDVLSRPLVEEDPENAEKAETVHYMNWIELGLILFGFSSPSGVTGVAYSISACGVIFGPLLCIVVTIATCVGALILNELVVELKPKTAALEAVGEALLGHRGGTIGRILQEANFVLYQPVALLICAQAVQGFMPSTWLRERCVDYFVVVTSVFCLLLTQLRQITGHAASILSYMSLLCVAVVAFIILWVVLTIDADDHHVAPYFGNPDMRSNHRYIERRRGVARLCLGASTTAWAYVPTFLTVEVSGALKRPKIDFEKGLLLSAGLNVLVFLLVGLICVRMWGSDLTDPIMATSDKWPDSEPRSKVLFFCWFVATAISYAFSSMALATATQRRWLPSLDLNDWSRKTSISFFFITLPFFLLALLMALVVPSLFVMLTITTAFTVPWVNFFYPALLYHVYKKRDQDKDKFQQAQHGQPTWLIRTAPPWLLTWGLLLIGILIFAACAIGAVAKLADHQLRGPMSIGCPGWQIFEDDLN